MTFPFRIMYAFVCSVYVKCTWHTESHTRSPQDNHEMFVAVSLRSLLRCVIMIDMRFLHVQEVQEGTGCVTALADCLTVAFIHCLQHVPTASAISWWCSCGLPKRHVPFCEHIRLKTLTLRAAAQLLWIWVEMNVGNESDATSCSIQYMWPCCDGHKNVLGASSWGQNILVQDVYLVMYTDKKTVLHILHLYCISCYWKCEDIHAKYVGICSTMLVWCRVYSCMCSVLVRHQLSL